MRYFILFLTLTLGLQAQAQRITGRLLASDGTGLPGAAVVTLAKDSSLIEGTVTDDDGRFAVKGDTGSRTIVRAQALDYATRTWLLEGSDAGSVLLARMDAKELKAVEVVAQKPLLEIHADKMVVNVANSINQTGNNALDVLRKSPGVVVDKDDNIQLKGKSGIRILIDGKPAILSGTDLANYLKSLQSQDIENIELITNPSAKYEAQGSAGIINIRLKKNRNFGTNGSLSATYAHGVFNRYSQGLNLNHRNKRVNLFGNISGWEGNNRNWFDLIREQADSVYTTSAPSTNMFQGFNYKGGADFFIDSRNTIGVMANGTQGHFSDIRESFTTIRRNAPGEEVARILAAPNTHETRRGNVNANLNYRYADTSGHELTTDLDYGFYDNNSTQDVRNYYRTPSGETITTNYNFHTVMPVTVKIASAKVDYEQKLLGGSLAAGGRIANVSTRNNYQYFDSYTSNTDLPFNINRSNLFTYTERVSALYGLYKGQISKKISFQAGLRMEHTYSKGDLTYADISRHDSIVNRDYLRFFPSGGITWNPNQSHTFGVTYSSRIDRPNYQSLNPFEYNLDQLSAEKGNPQLQPQYTNSYELNYGFKGQLMTSIGYSNTRDMMSQGQFVDSADKRKGYVKDINLGSMDQVTLTVSSPTQIRPWWQGNVSLTGYRQWYTITNDQVVNLTVRPVTAFNGYAQQVFTLGKGYKAEVSGWYNSPAVWGGTFKNTAMGGVDMGLQKQVLDKRGNLKVSFTDVFHTMRWHGQSTYNGVTQVAWGRWESQQVRIAFDYRFGSDQIKGARQRRTAADELGGRVK